MIANAVNNLFRYLNFEKMFLLKIGHKSYVEKLEYYIKIITKWYTERLSIYWKQHCKGSINKGNSSIPLFKSRKSMDKKQNWGNKPKLKETH